MQYFLQSFFPPATSRARNRRCIDVNCLPLSVIAPAKMHKVAYRRSPRPTIKQSDTPIPTPFKKAPSTLLPFLERLDPAHVHITHLDRLPREHKQQIFLIPVLLNSVIALLLLWRLWIAVPYYWLLVQTLFGYATTATVDPATTTRGQQVRILLRRVGTMLFDFLLFRFVGPWPVSFFAEQPANPWLWRWRLGFKPHEAVVRVSRHWGTEDLMQGVKQGAENAFFKTRVLPAVEPGFMKKTGYLLMGASWDLDFELMLDAHALADRGEIKLEDLDGLVLAYQEEGAVGWIAWKFEATEDVTEARRKKIAAFKETLTAMGKESLFWKWMEIVEDERLGDDELTPDRQKLVEMRVQNEFHANGLDFDDIVMSIGGLEDLTLPGQ